MAQETNYSSYIIPGGLVIGAFIFGNKLLKAFNLVDDDDDKAEEGLSKMWFWNSEASLKKKHMTLTASSRATLAKKLYDAAGQLWKLIYNPMGYNDNEEQIYSVFRALNYQSQVTALVDAFNKAYNEDLYYWLDDKLSQKELLTIKKIIDQKPSGLL